MGLLYDIFMSPLCFLINIITRPNSPRGLIARAEFLEGERTIKLNDENYRAYAKSLRELAVKNWPDWKNKTWIKENLVMRYWWEEE